jgi:Chemotaxis phosphatase CheX
VSAEPLPERQTHVQTDIEAEIEAAREDLEGLLTDVLSSVFDEEVEVLPPSGDDTSGPSGEALEPDAAALVAVRDDRAGVDLGVHVRVSPVLARLLASRMFACDEPVSEDLLDAVGELGNIAGGNVKSLLFPSDSTARLSLPSAVLGGPATPPPARGDGTLPPSIRALVLGEPVELTLVPDVEAGALIWPPTAPIEVLEGQS